MIWKNEVLAIVGELRGCGKSTLVTSIMGLHNPIYTKVEGEIIFEDNNLVNYTEKEFNNNRKKIDDSKILLYLH